jgi:Aminotransferase class I and II
MAGIALNEPCSSSQMKRASFAGGAESQARAVEKPRRGSASHIGNFLNFGISRNLMNTLSSTIVHMLAPYVAGEQPTIPDLVKLNTNENPYGPSSRASVAIAGEVTNALGLYPDPSAHRLRTVIAQGYGLDASNIFVGNGSDEVLAHTLHASPKHNAAFFPDITYSFYPAYFRL